MYPSPLVRPFAPARVCADIPRARDAERAARPQPSADAWSTVLGTRLGRRPGRVLVATRDTSAAGRVTALGHAPDIVRPAALDDLPYGSATFDAVLLDELADTDADRDIALLECYRVLRRGGRLLMLGSVEERSVATTLGAAGFADVREHTPLPSAAGPLPWYRRWLRRTCVRRLTSGVRP